MLNAKENMLAAIRRDKPERVPDGMEAVITLRPPVIERPGAAGCDCFGVKWDYEELGEGGSYPAADGALFRDPDKWRETLVIPDPAAFDWSAVSAKAKETDRGQFLVQGFIEMGLWERMWLLFGMEEALVRCVSHPGEMSRLACMLADYKIKLLEIFDDTASLDMIWYGDDWGTQAGLFMPPDLWRRIIRPGTERFYQAAKKRGILVNQHSCGKIEEIFSDITEMGADIWNPCQPCNDLARLKKDFGDRITFSGGIDSQFVLARPGVTPSEVRAEVRRRISEMGSGGGYIATPSHGVPYDPEITRAMHEAIKEFGAYPPASWAL
jgi:hypothetical protein